jgi:hypothetical protein
MAPKLLFDATCRSKPIKVITFLRQGGGSAGYATPPYVRLPDFKLSVVNLRNNPPKKYLAQPSGWRACGDDTAASLSIPLRTAA